MAVNLSHPEILSVEKLQEILSSRGLPTKDLVDKSKNDLVQLFYRFVVPLPQRKSHMRRANRLKTLTIVNRATDVKEGKLNNRGIKRKCNSLEMEKILQTKEVSNYLHDSNGVPSCSPTTECTNKITKLSMNCKVSKPLKLNRERLFHDHKQNNCAEKPKILNIIKSSEVLESAKLECSQTSNKTFEDVKREASGLPATPKKFKRITVTWP